MLTALALASLAYMPGDGIVSLRVTLVPQSVHIVLIDEGIEVEGIGYGQLGWDMLREGRAMIQDIDLPPGTVTPLLQCIRAAKEACGAGGVKSVTATAKSCTFTCYPQPTTPSNPTTPRVPPTAPGAGA
jgi:hypothetical protein